jgi:glucose-1-phosphate thymidylyltransferase
MKAVIPAAGQGTRLRPLTDETPKPLLEVAGKPILTRCFETLLDIGIDSAVVVVGYRGEQIVEHYGDAYRGLDIEYVHQSERKGLAHAVLTAEPCVDEEFVVVNGDNVYAANLNAVLDRHTATNADVTFPITEVSPERATEGAVCIFDDDGTLTGLVEKPDDPPSTQIPAACYVLPPAAFQACERIDPSERGEYELADAIELLLYSGYSVETVPFEGWKVNVNTEADIERAEAKLASESE